MAKLGQQSVELLIGFSDEIKHLLKECCNGKIIDGE